MTLMRSIAAFVLLVAANSAAGCPDGYYNTGIGVCLPNSGTVIPDAAEVLGLPDILNTVTGAVSGDMTKLSQGVGGLVIKAACLGCNALGDAILKENDKVFLETIVGRGYLLFLVGTDPTLIVLDAAASTVRQYALKPAPPPIPVVVPPKRKMKRFNASKANCIVEHTADKKVVAGWAAAPSLVEPGTDKPATYPDVDIREDDVVQIESSEECGKLPEGQVSLKQTKIVYFNSIIVPGAGPAVMKYFFNGQLANKK